jgi:hypothetical protein
MSWAPKSTGAIARATVAGANPLTVSYPNTPTPIAAGDTIYCALADTVASITFTFSDTDFVPVVSRSGNAEIALYWKAANGTETGTFTVTPSSASAGLYAQTASFTGGPAATSGNVHNSSADGFAPSLTLVFPALTITAPGCLVMVVAGKNAGLVGLNIPSPFTNELGQAHFASSECFVWDYVIQTTAANVSSGSWTITSGDASASQGCVVAAMLPLGAALAGAATAATSATGDLDRVAGAAGVATSATAALSTAIQAAGTASASATAVGALTNWTTVTLSGTQYTGPGGVHDPNFWLDVDPPVGSVLYYDATHITIYANGEISSDTNNCSAVVQFFDGTAWSVGIVIITPNFVSYAHVLAAAAGALSTSITMAGAAIAASQATGGLSTGIHLAGIALGIANAAASLTTGVQMNAAALITVTATGALTGGVASLQGSGTAATQALGALTTRIQNAGQVIIDSQAVGALSARIPFQGAANALTQAAGTLSTAIQLAGNPQVVVTATGAALISSAFAGAANVVSSAMGSLLTGLLIAGNALVTSSAAGDLSTGITLGGAAIVDTAAALKPVGLEGQFGKAVITVLSPTGLPVDRATFIQHSACIVSIAYFNAQGLPFVPSAVSYRVDDEGSGVNLVPFTPIQTPSMANSITITGAQNAMVSFTRDSEEHEILFAITDGVGNVNYASAVYDLIRVAGAN